MGRVDADAYLTPDDLALAFCTEARKDALFPTPERVIEPSAGEGAFVRAVKSVWPEADVLAIEMRKECEPMLKAAKADSISISTWEETPPINVPDLIVGNPPFSLAQSHIELALERLEDGGHLAFLLRMSFLGSQKRAASFWDVTPGFRYLQPLVERAAFVKGSKQTDDSEYGIYVWQKGYTGRPEVLSHLWWRR